MSAIRKYRLKNKVTQLELAKHLKVSPQFICNHEQKPHKTPFPADKMKKCAKLLRIPVRILIDERVEQFRKMITKDAGVR